MKFAIVLLLICSVGASVLSYYKMIDTHKDYRYKKDWLEKHFATPSDDAARELFFAILFFVCSLIGVVLFSAYLIYKN